jgi:hypothetical protein
MLHAALLAAYLTAQGADVGTTLALRGPSTYEANPFVPRHPVPFLVVKAGVTTGAVLYGWRIRKSHPKAAAGLFLVGAVSGSLGAVLNARLLRRARG